MLSMVSQYFLLRLLIVSSYCIVVASTASYGQRTIDFFEPDFDSSLCKHLVLYSELLEKEFYPVHYSQFRSRVAVDNKFNRLIKIAETQTSKKSTQIFDIAGHLTHIITRNRHETYRYSNTKRKISVFGQKGKELIKTIVFNDNGLIDSLYIVKSKNSYKYFYNADFKLAMIARNQHQTGNIDTPMQLYYRPVDHDVANQILMDYFLGDAYIDPNNEVTNGAFEVYANGELDKYIWVGVSEAYSLKLRLQEQTSRRQSEQIKYFKVKKGSYTYTKYAWRNGNIDHYYNYYNYSDPTIKFYSSIYTSANLNDNCWTISNGIQDKVETNKFCRNNKLVKKFKFQGVMYWYHYEFQN